MSSIKIKFIFTTNKHTKHILPPTGLLLWIHERSTIKPHVQVFLRMNTWMFGTCRRHYDELKHKCEKCALCWFSLHNHNTTRTSICYAVDLTI